jgi:nucleoside-diphosphate-sugar epimerase
VVFLAGGDAAEVRLNNRTIGLAAWVQGTGFLCIRNGLLLGGLVRIELRNNQRTRSFCYVDYLVDGLMRLMATPDEATGPMNLGNPVEFTVKQLAELVIALTGSS